MTSPHRALGLAAREVSIHAAFTDAVVAFGVDLETKAGVCSRITSTDGAFIWRWDDQFSESLEQRDWNLRLERTDQVIFVHNA